MARTEAKLVVIDGSQGEGGGQILRTSLSLSILTGTPVRIENVRAGRQKPGLLRQHLAAVRGAAAVGDAEVEGAALGSRELTFRPRGLRPGNHHFAVGSAGSASLVLQTVLPPLLGAGAPSRLTLEGGTHNPMAPPWDFLERTFLPLLGRMGARLQATLVRHGFYPAGGGLFHVEIAPCKELRPLHLLERGTVRALRARAILAHLPRSVGEREIATVRRKLEIPEDAAEIREVPSPGPGNALVIDVASDELTEVFTGFGARGVTSERVATGAVEEARDYLASGVPVGPHLADQLLLPMAIAGGGSFRTQAPTPHTSTNVEVIRRFLDVPISVEPGEGRTALVTVGAA